MYQHQTVEQAKQAALADLTRKQCQQGRHIATCQHRKGN